MDGHLSAPSAGPALALLLQDPFPMASLGPHPSPANKPLALHPCLLWGPKPCRDSTLAVTCSRSSSLLDLSFLTCKMETKGLPPGVIRGDTAWEDANRCKEGCQVITQ